MKRAFFALLLALVCVFPLMGQLPDDQVLEIISQASQRGLNQTEIAAELARRGVSQQQLLRISNGAGSGSEYQTQTQPRQTTTQSRLRSDPATEIDPATGQRTTRGETRRQTEKSTDRRSGIDVRTVFDENGIMLSPAQAQLQLLLDSMVTEAVKARRPKIFGHDVFSGRELTFEPSLNIASPENYLLGPGDEVIIDVWGESEQTIREEISPDGTIVVRQLGPVTLGGFTVAEADARIKRQLGAIYSAASGEAPATFMKLSLGRIRTIQVHVMGEVEKPGSYSLPSLATLFHVLYSAGGVNDIGSLREISVSRGGRRVATVDVYSYLLEGRTDVDIALRDGDVVMVPPWVNMVEVAGEVKRPMKYEMKQRETLASLLDYSGGFAGGAYTEAVTVVRRSGRLRQVHDVTREGFGAFAMADGDSVAVGGIPERFENRLEISGAVFRPGLYSVTEGSTVGDLVRRAEGLMGDAFTARGVLRREKEDYTFEVLPVDIGAIMAGVEPDVPLRNNDVLHIPSIMDLREEYFVTIQGEVKAPGEYDYADNMTIEDMIVSAGGLLESASTVRADVYRRIKNPSSMFENDARSESYSFAISPGLRVEQGDFTLMPFDIVTIRTSPGYEVQKPVAILGEVLFPGDYTLVRREERLSDLVRMSGGALSTAYLQGAKLIRKRAEDEQTRAQSALRLTQMVGRDSLSTASLNVESNYSVGIELDKALAMPHSDYDLVLTEGDVLFVPEYVGTVAVSGAVLYPNTVSYREGMTIRQYVDQAGGYAHRARKGAMIVIYMNGTIARAKRGARIAPGCEIVVPYKAYRNSARASVAELVSMGASATSAASLVTSIINSLR